MSFGVIAALVRWAFERTKEKMQRKIRRYAAKQRHEGDQYRHENGGVIASEQMCEEYGRHDRHGRKDQFAHTDCTRDVDTRQSTPQFRVQVCPGDNVAC